MTKGYEDDHGEAYHQLQTTGHHSYLTKKTAIRELPKKGGMGIIALQPIEKDELIAVWAGKMVTYEELAGYPEAILSHTVQLEENLYQVSVFADEPADFINHSCEPNCGMNGQLSIVAMRHIEPGEEVTLDYCMCEGTDYLNFTCECGVKSCRGAFTGSDWKINSLWDKYRGYYSPFLQNRIDCLRTSGRQS